MRRTFILVLLIVFPGSTIALAQSCELNLIGTWKTIGAEYDQPLLYKFAPGGRVTVSVASRSDTLAQPPVIAEAKYEVDNAKSPKLVTITTTIKNSVFAVGATPMKIVAYDDTSMTCELPRIGKTGWVKIDPHRYFMILAARNGEFYDTSGSAFPILIKTVGETQVEAVGTYSNKGRSAFGKVPAEAYKEFLAEPTGDSQVMLRIEINPAQYERGLKILQTWDRRVREDAVLYTNRGFYSLNNVLLVKAVTETLNQCGETVDLYKLNYIHPEDWISDVYGSPFIPFFYFKELRRLNEARHIGDNKFREIAPSLFAPTN